jgi:hypothetical protein
MEQCKRYATEKMMQDSNSKGINKHKRYFTNDL